VHLDYEVPDGVHAGAMRLAASEAAAVVQVRQAEPCSQQRDRVRGEYAAGHDRLGAELPPAQPDHRCASSADSSELAGLAPRVTGLLAWLM
jgi:hypothetical protein